SYQLENTEQANVTRNVVYGSDPSHRFDWFEPQGGVTTDQPTVILFVHGGGFVSGDKSEPGGPLYDNIGYWAAAHGLCAATITYRLAPAHPWPAGAEDTRNAAQAVIEHVKSIKNCVPRIIL